MCSELAAEAYDSVYDMVVPCIVVIVFIVQEQCLLRLKKLSWKRQLCTETQFSIVQG